MTKNVFIWGWHTPCAAAAINSLQKCRKINIVAWVGGLQECTHDLDRVVHQFNINSNVYSGAASEIYDQLYAELPSFLEFYSRVSFSLGRSYHELLHIFNMYLDYFAHLLKIEKVDLVLFSNLPHFGVDYILYLVARGLGVQVVMTTQSLVANRFYYLEDIDDFGVFSFANADPSMEYLAVENRFEKHHFYMDAKFLKKAMRRKSCCLSLANDLFHSLFSNRSKPMTPAGAVQKFQECLAFNKFAAPLMTEKVDFSNKYVYFPFQLQPELTTSTLGGRYVDQLLALEHLSDMLPDGWLIYVKENPKQNRRQRDHFFFKRLSRIRNAVYVSTRINTYELMQESQFVAVVTGTAGWEALTGGKKALVFGKSWYRKLPGAFEYHHDLEIKKILSYQINHQELERSYNELIQRTAYGVVDPGYNVLVPNYSDERNILNLIKFLGKVLCGL